MRFYLKVFAASFLCFALVIGAGLYIFMKPTDENPSTDKSGGIFDMFSGKKEITEEDRLHLDRMTEKSSRVNVLMMGTDGGRSDTMMMVSYDPDTKLIDIVSVPRDTYYQIPGKSPMKMNAIVGLKGDLGGPSGTSREVSKVLGVPVDYYVAVDYKAVEEVVDIIGGVEIEIPRRMKYDDPYAEPELHIDLKAGKQKLNGDQAIQFLRWRKNNDGSGGAEGDLGRIERQQAFVKTAIKKALGLKLPLIIPTAVKYVKTDMPVGEMLKLGTSMIGMDMSKTRSYRIPGEAKTISGASYYLHYPKATEAVMLAIYNRTGDETPVEGTLTKLEEVVDPSKVIKDSKKTLVEGSENISEEKPKKETPKAEVTTDSETAEVDIPEGDQSNLIDPAVDSNEIPADFQVDPATTDDTSLEDIEGTTIPEPVPDAAAPPVEVAPVQ